VRWKRLLRLAASLLAARVVLFLTPVAYQGWFEWRQGRVLEQVALGSSRAELEARLGAPTYVTDGTRSVEPEYPRGWDELIPGCVVEDWYHSRLTFIASRYSYCFDASDRLVHKYHWLLW
jgi:hypothetical protein